MRLLLGARNRPFCINAGVNGIGSFAMLEIKYMLQRYDTSPEIQHLRFVS